MEQEARLGIFLTDSFLQCSEIVYGDEGAELTHCDTIYFPETIDFRSDRPTKIMNLMQSAYAEMTLTWQPGKMMPPSAKGIGVIFSLPSTEFIVHQLPFEPSLLFSDLIEEFRWEFSVLHPEEQLDEYAFMFNEIPENPLATETEMAVQACSKKMISVCKEFCTRNNLAYSGVQRDHVSHDRFLRMLNPDAQGYQLSLFLSRKLLSIHLQFDGALVYAESKAIDNFGELPTLIQETVFKRFVLLLRKSQLNGMYLQGEHLSPSLIRAVEKNLEIPFKQITLPSPFFRTEDKAAAAILENTSLCITPSIGAAV